VAVLDGDPREHWASVDRAVRASGATVVGVPLPGTVVAPAWIAAVRLALAGDRTAVAVGAGAAPDAAPPPLVLVSRTAQPVRYAPIGEPPEWVAVRRELYEQLGGFDPALAVLGPAGPLLELVERALDAGHVVAYAEPPGVEGPLDGRRRRRRYERQRRTARAGLMYRHAARLGGPRGALWMTRWGVLPLAHALVRAVARDPARGRYAVRATRAFVKGCRIAARHPELTRPVGPRERAVDTRRPPVQDALRQER
jgi:hypothetical protein